MTFHVTEDQQEKINKFINAQNKKTGGYYGAIGGGFTYQFTPTSIGVVLRVENCLTHESIDVTDYDTW